MWILRSRPFVAAMIVLCAGVGYLCVSLGKEFTKARAIYQEHERGIELFKDGQYEEALPLIESALAREPERADLYRIAGYIAYRMGKTDDLRRYGEDLVARIQGPEAAKMHLHLGLLDLKGASDGKGDLASAVSHFEAALKEDEGLLDARAALGIALSLQDEAARARPRQTPSTPKAAPGGDAARAHLERAWADAQAKGPSELTPIARLWEIGDILRRGDPVEAWVAYGELYPAGTPPPKEDYATPIAFALAFRANAPAMSSVVRRLCLSVIGNVPKKLQDQYPVQLHTVAAEAFERLGQEQEALDAYAKAYAADSAKTETTRRNLAHALHTAAAHTADKQKAAEIEEKSLGIYRELLTPGGLAAEERRPLAMALATRFWRDGRTEEALGIVESAGDPKSLPAIRMRIAEALGKNDFKAASALLHEAQKLDPDQPDVAALLKRLTLPPEVLNFRVNSWGHYDPRPILSAAVIPRALPIPIAKDKLSMKLDGEAVQPLRTQGEVFYRPIKKLEPGEHRVEVSATDSIGLSVTKTLTFTIEHDQEPPRVVGLTPPDKGTTATLEPVIACRCTDPSDIDEFSLSVAFSGRGGKPVHQVKNQPIVDKGRYLIDFPRLNIKKGSAVRSGAVAFQFGEPLGEGECSVRVSVADTRGNRAVKTWTFKVAAPAPAKEPGKR